MVDRILSICNYIVMDRDKILAEFGKNLRAERNRAGYSQDGLADAIGICAGKHIGTIERGETNPTLTTIVAIMKVLNVDFDKLFDMDKDWNSLFCWGGIPNIFYI